MAQMKAYATVTICTIVEDGYSTLVDDVKVTYRYDGKQYTLMYKAVTPETGERKCLLQVYVDGRQAKTLAGRTCSDIAEDILVDVRRKSFWQKLELPKPDVIYATITRIHVNIDETQLQQTTCTATTEKDTVYTER